MGESNGRERQRRRIEDLGPEARARVEAKLAEWHSPGHRAAEEAAREAIARDGGLTTPTGFQPARVDASSPTAADFGRRLKALREARGLSVEKVVRASGIERSALFKLESGRNANPTITTLERYAVALGGRLRLDFEPLTEASEG